jgi:predicted Zn-dependent peptidase
MNLLKRNFKRKVLKNGMTILFEKRNVPVVSVAIAVRNGGINEDLDEKGISHFIEHMLYKGTKNRSCKDIACEIEKNGGELNGFTSEEVTAYWCKMPSRHIDVALEVLSDMVNNPLFDSVEFEKERKVIFEEIKLYHDNPRLHVFDEIQKQLYSGTLSVTLAGTIKTMNSISRDKMVEFFKERYCSNNLILCVVGNCEFSKIVDFANKNFKNSKSKIPIKPIGLRNARKIEEREGLDQANLVLAYHSPLIGDKKSAAADLLATLMAGGMSSRLFSEIREKRNLAYAIKGDYQGTKNFAYSFIYVGTSKENIALVEKLILEEFENLSTTLTQKELDSIKEQMIGNYQISMEDSQNQMVNLLSNELDSTAEDFYKFEEKIKKVKLTEVKELAKKVKGNYSLFALVPKSK